MTFLELVRRAWVEAGQSGDGPASVTNVSGHQLRFVNWVRKAWRTIQSQHDQWSFLKFSKDCTLTGGQESYASGALAITDLKIPLNVFVLVDGSWSPIFLSISDSSAESLYRQNKKPGRPGAAFFNNGIFSFDTIPDDAYQIRIDYRRKAQDLTSNTDIPYCDETYHMAIVWLAVQYYALFDEDQTLVNSASADFNVCLSEMRRDLLPRLRFGSSAF